MHETRLQIQMIREGTHPETGEPTVTVGFARPLVSATLVGEDAQVFWRWVQSQLTHPLPTAPRRSQIAHRRRMQRLRPRRKRFDDEQD